MRGERIQLLAVVGAEESTQDLVRFTGIVVLGFEADVTFLAVSPRLRQEFSVSTDAAKDILSEWEINTPATRLLAEVEEWLVRYRMVKCDAEDRAISTPFRRLESGGRGRSLQGLDGQDFRLHLREGNLDEEVVLETQANDYGLLFLGHTRRRHRLTRVLQFTAPPTLVVRKWTSQEYRFLVCLDGSPQSRRALALATRIAKVLVAPLDVIAIHGAGLSREKAQAELDRASRYLGRSFLPHRTILEKGRFEPLVLQHAGENTIITLGTSHRGQMWQLFLGATPFRIARQALGPVLIVK